MPRVQKKPQIQPQPTTKPLTCSVRIDCETLAQLQTYAEFIHSDRSHVIRGALRHLFSSDQVFQRHLRERALAEPTAECSATGSLDPD